MKGGCTMFERFINASEVMSRPVCDPRDTYGPPLIKYMLRVRDRDTGKWWYVRTFTRSRDDRRYTFTSDPTYARLMSLRSAREHQANMTTDVMNR